MKAILLPTLQGASFLGPKSRLKSIFEAQKSIKSRFWTQTSILSRNVEKIDFKYRFFDLKWLDSHSFDGFKCLEATQNKSRKTIFDNPNYSPFFIHSNIYFIYFSVSQFLEQC